MTRDDGAAPVRVLIADHDSRVRTALRRLLSASPGFEVVADSGSPATVLELARRHDPSVAIVGVRPQSAADGLGLLRAITGELHVPAVAMSTRSGVRVQALAAGASRFVEQGSSPDLLLSAVRAAARQ